MRVNFDEHFGTKAPHFLVHGSDLRREQRHQVVCDLLDLSVFLQVQKASRHQLQLQLAHTLLLLVQRLAAKTVKHLPILRKGSRQHLSCELDELIPNLNILVVNDVLADFL